MKTTNEYAQLAEAALERNKLLIGSGGEGVRDLETVRAHNEISAIAYAMLAQAAATTLHAEMTEAARF